MIRRPRAPIKGEEISLAKIAEPDPKNLQVSLKEGSV